MFNDIALYQCKTIKLNFIGLDAEFPDSIQLFFFSSHPLPSMSSPSWLHVCEK